MVSVLLSFCKHAHIMTFSSSKDRPTARPPVTSFLWDPPHSTLGFSPPRPVTRQGVRGLIICTDPGLSPQGGCLGTVALDPIDTVKGRRRGEENRPWLQSVGPPRQVDECPGLHDLCHPSQWSQATMSYSLLVWKPSCSPPPPPPHPASPRAPQSPQNPSWPASLPPQTLEVYPWLLRAALLPPPFNSRPWLHRFYPATRTHRSNHKLAQVTSACHFITPIAAHVRLLQRRCIREPDTWLLENIRWRSLYSFPSNANYK